MPELRMTIPKEIQGQKYISLATFRKNGQAVNTAVWFAEHDGKLYVKTRNDSGKYKRIGNNPQIKVAACTMGGKITGPEFSATARVLPPEQWPEATKALHRKYWLSRLPFWSKNNVFLEIVVAS
jgi:PPOX class probable F420-dependent enzyme